MHPRVQVGFIPETKKTGRATVHSPQCRLRCRVYVNVLLAFVAGKALTQRRNSTREAIGWVTPSSDQLDHASRRIRTRSAVGIFSTHRQRGRRHICDTSVVARLSPTRSRSSSSHAPDAQQLNCLRTKVFRDHIMLYVWWWRLGFGSRCRHGPRPSGNSCADLQRSRCLLLLLLPPPGNGHHENPGAWGMLPSKGRYHTGPGLGVVTHGRGWVG